MTTEDFDDTLRAYQAYKEQRDSEKPPRFELISLHDLLELPDPLYSNLVDDMLPAGGTSIVVAKPKIGKSTLAQQLTRCVAAGVPFLGRDVRESTVIYLAFEEKDSEVKKSYRLAGTPADLPIFFHFGEPPDDKFNALRAMIGEYTPGLVVVDTLAYWMGVADFNDYGQVGAALRPLHALAREMNTHIMCVHHAGKNAGGTSGIDSPLGSTALTGNVDTIVVLTEGDEDARILETRQRYGEHLPKTVLSFDKDARTFSVEGTVRDGRRRELEDAITAALSKGPLTEPALREQLKTAKARLLATLDRMAEAGIIERAGTGVRGNAFRYSLLVPFSEPDTGPTQSSEDDYTF